MGLPYFIEYLLTLERPGGGRLVHIGLTQTIVPAFPPGYTLTYHSAPQNNRYACLWFRSHLSPNIVPGAFTGWGQQYGASLMNGTLSELVVGQQSDYYIIVTDAEPYIGQLTNVSGLNQYFEGVTAYLDIETKEDMKLVRMHLERLTSSPIEPLVSEAVKVLGEIQRKIR